MLTHWLAEHQTLLMGAAAFVATVGLPALYTGLTVYDKERSALKAMIAFLSVLTHRDSPGTFKPPFSQPKPPEAP